MNDRVVAQMAPSLLAGLATMDDGRKEYWHGTHRTAPPEATIARISPLMGRMGITRLADITGLDRLGIPVYAAYRPNSRSLSVFQGKGLTPAAAKVSALMEAAELFHAETITLPIRLASAAELQEQVAIADVDRLPRLRPSRFDEETLLPWIAATDIVNGECVHVPYELVSANYTLPEPPGSRIFAATTNGLASGNHPLEALAHGLYEVIERDAVTLWRLACAREGISPAVDRRSVEAESCQGVLEKFARAGAEVRIWDVTSDIGVPAFLCLAADRERGFADPEVGSGCHLDREVALLRALTEAAQARTTWIAGARDDFDPFAYSTSARNARLHSGQSWLQASETADIRDVPTLSGHSLREDVATIIARLGQAGLERVLYVDLSKRSLDIAVMRVVVPGLEGPIQQDCVRGARARRRWKDA